jgi:hypothetical protein
LLCFIFCVVLFCLVIMLCDDLVTVFSCDRLVLCLVLFLAVLGGTVFCCLLCCLALCYLALYYYE